jgi:hypothetical protein
MMKKNIYIIGFLVAGCLLAPSKISSSSTAEVSPTLKIHQVELKSPLTEEDIALLNAIMEINTNRQ